MRVSLSRQERHVGAVAGSIDLDFEEVEGAVGKALEAGSPEGLAVLGYGEISLVLGWPPDSPRWALKRLPIFPDSQRLRAYEESWRSYVSELQSRGVTVLESEFRKTGRAEGGFSAYVVQPLVPEGDLLVERLRRAAPGEARSLLAALVDLVRGAVGGRLGIDAQVSNWAVRGGELVYFDVSTPLMRDDSGAYLLDVDLFVDSLPALLRWPVKAFVVDSILRTYFDERSVMLDLAANFYKDGIERLLPDLLEVLHGKVSPPLDEREVFSYHRRDAFLWSALQRARRLDRWWQRRVRGRVYPYLLQPTLYAGRKASRRPS